MSVKVLPDRDSAFESVDLVKLLTLPKGAGILQSTKGLKRRNAAEGGGI